MISQTAEYALRAVLALAQRPEKPLTTGEIAHATKVPEFYLSKVLHGLAKGEIVSSKRGVNGGYMLSRPGNQIKLLEIINAVDPIKLIKKCPLKLKTHSTDLCALHSRINQSILLKEDVFREATIQMILEYPSKSIPLCES